MPCLKTCLPTFCYEVLLNLRCRHDCKVLKRSRFRHPSPQLSAPSGIIWPFYLPVKSFPRKLEICRIGNAQHCLPSVIL